MTKSQPKPTTRTPRRKKNPEPEAKIYETQKEPTPEPAQTPDTSAFLNQKITDFKQWFFKLSPTGQIIVTAVGIGGGIFLFKTIFELVSMLLSIAIIVGLGFLAYKFLVNSNQP